MNIISKCLISLAQVGRYILLSTKFTHIIFLKHAFKFHSVEKKTRKFQAHIILGFDSHLRVCSHTFIHSYLRAFFELAIWHSVLEREEAVSGVDSSLNRTKAQRNLKEAVYRSLKDFSQTSPLILCRSVNLWNHSIKRPFDGGLEMLNMCGGVL